MGDKKLVTTQFALDADQTFTVVSTNTTSPGIMGSEEQERKVSASTRTGTIMKLPIA